QDRGVALRAKPEREKTTMPNNLLNNVKQDVVIVNQAGTASTVYKGAILDMLGWEGVLFTAVFGDVVSGSVVTLRAAHSDINDTAEMAVSDAAVQFTAGASNLDDKAMSLDVVHPTKRYIEVQVAPVTQNAPIRAVIATRYRS